MKKIYLMVALFSLLGIKILAGELSTKEIREPKKSVIDITRTNNSEKSFEEYLQKSPVQINYIWGYKNRANFIDNCKTDSHSATYCPLDMAPCGSEWDYKDSTSTTTQKTTTATPGSCTGIQVGGTCYTKTTVDVCNSGDVYNATTKTCAHTTTSTAAPINTVASFPLNLNNNFCTDHYTRLLIRKKPSNPNVLVFIYASMNPAGAVDNRCGYTNFSSGKSYINDAIELGMNEWSTSQLRAFMKAGEVNVGAAIVNNLTNYGFNYNSSGSGCHSLSGTITGSISDNGFFGTTNITECPGNSAQTPNIKLSGNLSYNSIGCANGTLVNNQCVITNVSSLANNCTNGSVPGSTLIGGDATKCYQPASVCEAGYEYNAPYYKCDDPTYTLSGLNCIKTTTGSYLATLSSASVLLKDNCEGGLKPIDNASAYCASKGMRLPKSTEIVPNGGTITHCGSGYTWTSDNINYGYGWGNGPLIGKIIWNQNGVAIGDFDSSYLTRCIKNDVAYTCPNGGVLNGNICNTTTVLTVPATLVGSSCSMDYKYYSYQCSSGTNQFGKDWQVINAGGIDCGGQNLVDTNNDGIKDSCTLNQSASNCKREKFSCVANTARPCAEVGGTFQCSPYACDSDKKCGYAHCPTEFGISNTNEITPLSADPLKYTLKGTVCKGLRCDLVDGPYYSMCGKKSCPQGFGVYEKDGACYKDACPSGTVEIDGECVKKN